MRRAARLARAHGRLELRGEKIDIIPWNTEPARFVAKALSPARVREVYIDDESREATVVVPDDQLALAIGKEGLNARLAARLTGWKVDIKSDSEFAQEEADAAFAGEDDGDGDFSGRCAALLSNGKRCPNAALPGSKYCGVPAHQALVDSPAPAVAVEVEDEAEPAVAGAAPQGSLPRTRSRTSRRRSPRASSPPMRRRRPRRRWSRPPRWRSPWRTSRKAPEKTRPPPRRSATNRDRPPLRTCVGCGRRAPQHELVRFAAMEGVLTAGRTLPGRGAYTCPDVECFERACSRGGVQAGVAGGVTVLPALAHLYTEGLNG